MRSILVMADHRPGSGARVQTAIDLARRTQGHVTVLVDTPVARFIANDPMGGSYVVADALHQARESDDDAAAAIEAHLALGDVPFEVVRSESDPVDALAKAARLADLTIVPHWGDFAGELALISRTPVLALPDARPLSIPVRRACVAWEGGEQVAAALRASVALLGACQLVKIVTVTGKVHGFPAAEAARYLSRHGVQAEVEERERRGSVEETLAAAVAEAQAELLVMGAYGKSALREFLFGGVTNYFLTEPDAPALLIAH